MRGTQEAQARSRPRPASCRNVGENVLVLDYGTPESLEIIRERADELAAVLVEPVQSRRPDFQPREFLQRAARRSRATSGTLLIFDEVVTGFRAHPGGAQALFGIKADLASYGKVVGGGFPIGVIAGKREYMDALDGGALAVRRRFGADGRRDLLRRHLRAPSARARRREGRARAPEERQARRCRSSSTARTATMADELNAFCRRGRRAARDQALLVAVEGRLRRGPSAAGPAVRDDAQPRHPHPRQLPVLLHDRAHRSRLRRDHATRSRNRSLRCRRPTSCRAARRRSRAVRRRPSRRCPARASGKDRDGQPAWFVPESRCARQVHEGRQHDGRRARRVGRACGRLRSLRRGRARARRADDRSRSARSGSRRSSSREASLAYNEVDLAAPQRRARCRRAARRHCSSSSSATKRCARPSRRRRRCSASPRALRSIVRCTICSGLDEVARAQAIAETARRCGRNAVRSRARPADPRRIAALAADEHLLIIDRAPHRLRRLVVRRRCARPRGALCTSARAAPRWRRPAFVRRLRARRIGARRHRSAHGRRALLGPALRDDRRRRSIFPSITRARAVRSFASRREDHVLDADAGRRDQAQLGAQRGASFFATLLAGFARLLERLTGQDDLVIGIPTAGQSVADQAESRRPLRQRAAAARSRSMRSAVLARCSATCAASCSMPSSTSAHVRHAAETLPIARDPIRLPLVSVLFNLDQALDEKSVDFPGLDFALQSVPRTFENFELFINAVQDHGTAAPRMPVQQRPVRRGQRAALARCLRSAAPLGDRESGHRGRCARSSVAHRARDDRCAAAAADSVRPSRAHVRRVLRRRPRARRNARRVTFDGKRLELRRARLARARDRGRAACARRRARRARRPLPRTRRRHGRRGARRARRRRRLRAARSGVSARASRVHGRGRGPRARHC